MAFTVKGVGLILGAGGLAIMWQALSPTLVSPYQQFYMRSEFKKSNNFKI